MNEKGVPARKAEEAKKVQDLQDGVKAKLKTLDVRTLVFSSVHPKFSQLGRLHFLAMHLFLKFGFVNGCCLRDSGSVR